MKRGITMRQSYYAALLILMLGTELLATEPLAFSSIRQIGMGGAGVAVCNGDAALYQNPALLTEIKKSEFKLPQLRVEIGKDLLSKQSDIRELVKSKSDSDQGAMLKKLVPTEIAAGGGLSSIFSYVSTGFGMGVFSNASVTGKLVNTVQPTLKIEGVSDVAPAIGYARKVSIFGQSFSLGASGKYVIRNTMYDKSSGTEYIEMGNADLIKAINDKTLTDKFKNTFQSKGFGVDLGVATPFSMGSTHGQFGFAVRNIGGSLKGKMKLDDGSSIDKTVTLPIESVLGVSATPSLPLFGRVLMAADYAVSPSSTPFKSLSMGAEKQFWNGHMSLRGGLHQGYAVFGVGVSALKCHLEYAYRTVENGTEVGQDPVSSHVLELGLRF